MCLHTHKYTGQKRVNLIAKVIAATESTVFMAHQHCDREFVSSEMSFLELG